MVPDLTDTEAGPCLVLIGKSGATGFLQIPSPVFSTDHLAALVRQVAVHVHVLAAMHMYITVTSEGQHATVLLFRNGFILDVFRATQVDLYADACLPWYGFGAHMVDKWQLRSATLL